MTEYLNPDDIADLERKQEWEDFYKANPQQDPRRVTSEQPAAEQRFYRKADGSLKKRWVGGAAIGALFVLGGVLSEDEQPETSAPATTTAVVTQSTTTAAPAPTTTSTPATTSTIDPEIANSVAEPEDSTDAAGLPANPLEVYADRDNWQDNDHESLVPGGTGYAGLNIYVDSVEFIDAEIEIRGHFFNRGSGPTRMTTTDWTLEGPDGEIYSPVASGTDAEVSAASGRSNDFVLRFLVPLDAEGKDAYLLHQVTDSNDDARGVWGIAALPFSEAPKPAGFECDRGADIDGRTTVLVTTECWDSEWPFTFESTILKCVVFEPRGGLEFNAIVVEPTGEGVTLAINGTARNRLKSQNWVDFSDSGYHVEGQTVAELILVGLETCDEKIIIETEPDEPTEDEEPDISEFVSPAELTYLTLVLLDEDAARWFGNARQDGDERVDNFGEGVCEIADESDSPESFLLVAFVAYDSVSDDLSLEQYGQVLGATVEAYCPRNSYLFE